MSTQTKPGCGRNTTMGHGEFATCGDDYYGVSYLCARCTTNQLFIARTLLSDALETFDANPAQDHEVADRIRAFLKGAA